MARSIAEIQAAMISDIQADATLSGLTSTSKRAIWRLWTFVFAVAISLLEQLMDIFKSDVEKTVSIAAPQTAQWLQNKVFEFQYSETNPQNIQLIDLIPKYAVTDLTLRIVTRCSVKTTLANSVLIKAAKSSVPEALTISELAALQSYINLIGVAGITYVASSGNSDKLYLEADIYYTGSYISVIKDNVISAINVFLSSIPFDGILKLSDLEIAIKNVTGVTDLFIKNAKARQDDTSLENATGLVVNQTYVTRGYSTAAGYIVGETSSGNTLADKLNFIAE